MCSRPPNRKTISHRFFTRVTRHIEQAKVISMCIPHDLGRGLWRAPGRFEAQLPGRQKLILPTLHHSDIDTETDLTPRPVVVRGKEKVF